MARNQNRNNKYVLPTPTNDLDNGIIHYLQKNNKQNQYFVEVSSVLSHPTDKWGGANVLTDYDIGSGRPEYDWCSSGLQENESFSISFTGFKIELTHYTFKSRTASQYDMPKGWVVEGSNSYNEEKWKEIDVVENEQSLLTCGSIKAFTINSFEPYSHFRFKQHVKNENDHTVFTLSKFEIYGKIIYPTNIKTCFCSNYRNYIQIYILILIS